MELGSKTQKRQTMLIADDIAINRMMLKRIFEDEYEVAEAGNGLEALEKLRTLPDVTVLVLDILMPELDGFGVLAAMQADERLRDIPTVVVTASDDEETQIRALNGGATDVLTKPFSPQIIFHRVQNIIARKKADRLAEENRMYAIELRLSEIDEKSGLYSKYAFNRRAARILLENPDKAYVLMRWDIDNFKVFNDCFGIDYGDQLLYRVGTFYRQNGKSIPGLAAYARYDADHFVFLREADSFDPVAVLETIDRQINSHMQSAFEFIPRMGLYRIDDPTLNVALMCDRALMALRSIKNRYDRRIAWYDDAMRQSIINEQEIISEMETALEDGQFVAYLQPQYNHDSHSLVGAEALVRWVHPQKGLIPPSEFLPLFERNGFISKLDQNIWEQVCRLLRDWQDEGLPLVPISVNISRRDIYDLTIGDVFCNLLEKYGIKPQLLHLEITETAYAQNADQLISAVNELRKYGMQVHMDDFGSGYSSLNMLKTVPVDMLKLDMKFLGGSTEDERSDSILNAVMRMADALRLPVLAEGVETQAQADMLKSIGCFLMQGYFFARPMPAESFRMLLKATPGRNSAEDLVGLNSSSALLFNSLMGGGALVEYEQTGGALTVMRINEQFLDVLRISRKDFLHDSIRMLEYFEEAQRPRIIAMLEDALRNGVETVCDAATVPSADGQRLRQWLRLRARPIVKNAERTVFYIAAENITQSKQLELKNLELVEQLFAVIDSVPGGVINLEIDADAVRAAFISDKLPEMCGYSPEEYEAAFSADPLGSIYPADRASVQESIRNLRADGSSVLRNTFRRRCKNGEWRWTQIAGRVVRRTQAELLVSVTVLDVHTDIEQQKANRYLTEYNRLLSSADGSMAFQYDPEKDRLTFSIYKQDVGLTEEVRENYLNSFGFARQIAPEDQAGYLRSLRDASRGKANTSPEYRADFLGSGSYRRYRDVYLSVPDEDGRILRVLGRVDDVEEQALRQELHLKSTQTDEATGLLSRNAARTIIERILREKPANRYDAMLSIETDAFAARSGPPDDEDDRRTLREIADAIKGFFRSDDIVFRDEGETFVVYMRSADCSANVCKKARSLITRLSLIDPSGRGALHCCIGAAGTNDAPADYDALADCAVAARHEAKQTDANRLVFRGCGGE